jgi:hypothetical protein
VVCNNKHAINVFHINYFFDKRHTNTWTQILNTEVTAQLKIIYHISLKLEITIFFIKPGYKNKDIKGAKHRRTGDHHKQLDEHWIWM